MRLPHASQFAALTWFVGGCAPVPADVSVPEPSTTGQADSGETRDPIDEPLSAACVPTELRQCTGVCRDRECLDWCGGSACVEVIADLWSCMGPAEQTFRTNHPAPSYEYEQVVEDGKTVDRPTADSVDRQFAWEQAYNEVIAQAWAQTCSARCDVGLAIRDEDPPGFCDDWRANYSFWQSMSESSDAQARRSGQPNADSIGVFGWGTTITVAGELGGSTEPHAVILHNLVVQTGWTLDDIEACVPDLGEAGREFTMMVGIGSTGTIVSIEPRVDPTDATGASTCVAEFLAAEWVVPARVAREFPQLELHVQVTPRPDWGRTLGGDEDEPQP